MERIKARISKMALFLSECKYFDKMPEGYWRDGDLKMYDIENEMSKDHIKNVISHLRFLQKQDKFCDKKKGNKFGEKVYCGEVFDREKDPGIRDCSINCYG